MALLTGRFQLLRSPSHSRQVAKKQELIIISVCSSGSKTKEGVVSSVNTGKIHTPHIISHNSVLRKYRKHSLTHFQGCSPSDYHKGVQISNHLAPCMSGQDG